MRAKDNFNHKKTKKYITSHPTNAIFGFTQIQ